MTPMEALERKPHSVIKAKESDDPKFKVGDKVRISRIKGTFEKGYTPNWSYEIFEVARVILTNPVTYKLKDYNNEVLDGGFYEPELQLTKQEPVYLVEKVGEERRVRRGRRTEKEYLVKWLGYSDKFNSWVNENEFEDLKK